jgi:hypothetical protein
MCILGPQVGVLQLHETDAPLLGDYERRDVEAFRVFRVKWGWPWTRRYLCSLFSPFVYEENPAYATHKPSHHRNNGFWAYKTEEYAYELMEATSILARVRVYGEVVEHADGYRGEWIRILAFLKKGKDVSDADIEELEAHYGLA